ncbi:Uncharacterised protein [Vibrio cholerae]|nr:Uncharacterised protein [Vibrio cholerae]
MVEDCSSKTSGEPFTSPPDSLMLKPCWRRWSLTCFTSCSALS